MREGEGTRRQWTERAASSQVLRVCVRSRAASEIRSYCLEALDCRGRGAARSRNAQDEGIDWQRGHHVGPEPAVQVVAHDVGAVLHELPHVRVPVPTLVGMAKCGSGLLKDVGEVLADWRTLCVTWCGV